MTTSPWRKLTAVTYMPSGGRFRRKAAMPPGSVSLSSRSGCQRDQESLHIDASTNDFTWLRWRSIDRKAAELPRPCWIGTIW